MSASDSRSPIVGLTEYNLAESPEQRDPMITWGTRGHREIWKPGTEIYKITMWRAEPGDRYFCVWRRGLIERGLPGASRSQQAHIHIYRHQ